MICQMFHTVSRMRENCTYGSMRGRTYPAGAFRSTLRTCGRVRVVGFGGFVVVNPSVRRLLVSG